MNITLVLAVYNQLDLTKKIYKQIRSIYPNTPFVISSAGSTDGTNEWLNEINLNDNNLIFISDPNKKSFSENYNSGIMSVKTDKLVLIHNDMIIGKNFLENINELLTENMILSYTTIEPPIFAGHTRPGKILLNLGSSFDDFNYKQFDQFVGEKINNKTLYDGATFFMSGYKKTFEDIGYFDGVTYNPAFCEDDDFLIRAKLKGYELKTTECAIVYHFVSKTSRFGDDFKNQRLEYEYASNRNFVRKWGVTINAFKMIDYWRIDNFTYNKITIGLITQSKYIQNLEPFFDYIKTETLPLTYIEEEQKRTSVNLKNKFTSLDDIKIIVEHNGDLDQNDIFILETLRFSINNVEIGTYSIGNFVIYVK